MKLLAYGSRFFFLDTHGKIPRNHASRFTTFTSSPPSKAPKMFKTCFRCLCLTDLAELCSITVLKSLASNTRSRNYCQSERAKRCFTNSFNFRNDQWVHSTYTSLDYGLSRIRRSFASLSVKIWGLRVKRDDGGPRVPVRDTCNRILPGGLPFSKHERQRLLLYAHYAHLLRPH